MKGLSGIFLSLALLAMPGCIPGTSNNKMVSPARLSQGLVIILPGIEGESPLNRDIRDGLAEGGVTMAIPIYRWGSPVPVAGMLVNQVDFLGNRLRAGRIARMIVDYQKHHPNRPVFIVGHSGGAGLSVFAAEALPPDHQVEGLILLSGSISNSYNLSKALAKCRRGIVNFYSREDVGLLMVGTTLAGNVDGGHEPSAGAVGFSLPGPDGPAKLELYSKLWQVQMIGEGPHAHTASADRDFVMWNVAPWLIADAWPITEGATE